MGRSLRRIVKWGNVCCVSWEWDRLCGRHREEGSPPGWEQCAPGAGGDMVAGEGDGRRRRAREEVSSAWFEIFTSTHS